MKKKRLFITTGLISVINAMAIIAENDGYDNHLYVAARVIDDAFIARNRELILPGYFKEVFFDSDRKKYENADYLKQFDTVYLTAQPKWNFHLYHDNIRLIEEGISSYCHFPPSAHPSVKGAVLRNYLDHVFYMKPGFPVIKQNREKLRGIIKKIASRHKTAIEKYQKENQVLMLSQYIYGRIFATEKVLAFYQKHIERLIDLGYRVLFKNHPRINEDTFATLDKRYGENMIMLPKEINLPCEVLCAALNPVMTVASMSGAGISLADLYGIPAFGFGAKIIGEYPLNDYVNFYKRFYLNYIPHVSTIYDLPADLPDRKDLLKKRFYAFLNSARDWRTDPAIVDAHRRYIGEL